ncbi:hypothetical protein OROMI_023038 [Orobanche minor]
MAIPNPPPPPPQNSDESKDFSRKKLYTISFSFPFDIPSSLESAALRIVRNLESFSLYYATFVWTLLFVALIPKRKVSVVCLVATTEVAFLYSLMMCALPDSVILHTTIDKRIVYFLFVVTAVELILSKAGLHLLIVLSVTVPIVMLIATLTKRDIAVDEEVGVGEMVCLVEEKLGVGGGGDDATAQPENLV